MTHNSKIECDESDGMLNVAFLSILQRIQPFSENLELFCKQCQLVAIDGIYLREKREKPAQ